MSTDTVCRRPRAQISAVKDRPRRASASLRWPKSPRRARALVFSRAIEWVSRCGRYRVVRFVDGSGRYHCGLRSAAVNGRWMWLRLSARPIAYRKLKLAKRACERHAATLNPNAGA